jgi:catechol 2,3-dioxygenase-like lactoylglutathione lyase family enzyme
MIDHIALLVSDYKRSKEFYSKALAPLGFELVMEVEGAAGFGTDGKPEFWVEESKQQVPTHVAFRAGNRERVRRFYEAALEAGGRDNGPPGLRAHYHPDYYGAFVFDPDGHNIEAVCREPV